MMPVRSVRIDDDLWAELLTLAELYDVSISDLVRVGLSEYFLAMKDRKK